MTRPARAEVEIEQRAAALQARTNRAPEIDSAGPRQAQPPPESNPEAPNQRRERIARLVVVEVGKFFERHPLDRTESRTTSAIDSRRHRFSSCTSLVALLPLDALLGIGLLRVATRLGTLAR